MLKKLLITQFCCMMLATTAQAKWVDTGKTKFKKPTHCGNKSRAACDIQSQIIQTGKKL